MATIQQAIQTVASLETFQLHDDQPVVEAQSVAIEYEVSMDPNFDDRNAFIGAMSKFLEEARTQGNLNSVLENGKYYQALLYSWRSCSRAIPQVQSQDQANKVELYERTVEILDPEIRKLREFYSFQEHAVEAFCKEIKTLSIPERRKDYISETLLLTLGRMVNMFGVLDALKNMKACLNNDFSMFKRASGFLKSRTKPGEDEILENQRMASLAMFLANQNQITTTLKDQLEGIAGYDEVLADVVNLCADIYEQNLYVTPEEKHVMLKVMAFGLFLMDGVKSQANIYKNKKIRLERFGKLFKQLSVVPLYGDMQITLLSYIKRCPHFEESRWMAAAEQASEERGDRQDNIMLAASSQKPEHFRFIADLTIRLNDKKLREGNLTPAQARDLSAVVLRGFKLLAQWTALVNEVHCWKLSHPADKYTNRDCPENAEEYERAIRYNYNSEEKFALVELMSMIKGTAAILRRHKTVLVAAINQYLHAEVQDFMHVTLRELIRRTIKKKKKMLTSILTSIRDTCIDLLGQDTSRNDPAFKGEKDGKFTFQPQIPQRGAPPSHTQLYLVRTMLESCFNEKAIANRKTTFGDKDFSSRLIKEMESFFRKSFYYPLLMNFEQTIYDCTDLSQLWYREFFLELTMGARIQFPIDMSLPWILTDHILETKEASMMEYMFYPLDLYNDSANHALRSLKKQFLYDEIEAEVNLCFDQLVFKLSDQIFAHYKGMASSILLDKQFKSELADQLGGPVRQSNFHFASNKYEGILRQRHLQILGRSIDLNVLLTQRLVTLLKRAVSVAIGRYESTDLTGILELETLLAHNRLCHELLSAHVTLDPFDDILAEANESVSMIGGRIALHTLEELAFDFLPNFNYNSVTQRFTRTILSFAPDVTRENPPRAAPHFWYGSKYLNNVFASIGELGSGFFGFPHTAALVRLLGYGGVAFMLEELVKNFKLTLVNTLRPYVDSLMEGLPQSVKLPAFHYGSVGALGFFQLSLKPIISYRELKTEVFQSFREVGNFVIFTKLLEHTMSHDECFTVMQYAPFQKAGTGSEHDNSDVARTIVKLKEQMMSVPDLSSVVKRGQGSGVEAALQAESLCRPVMRDKLLFNAVLGRVMSVLHEEAPNWRGHVPANGVMEVEECKEFHRLWSAVQFVFCTPGNATEYSAEDLFGEGLQWAGCTLMYLLGQHRRFEVLDFSYHIANVNRVDLKEDSVSGTDLKRFSELVRFYQRRNAHIFETLEKQGLQTADSLVHYSPPS
eukprot:Opistho-2@59637